MTTESATPDLQDALRGRCPTVYGPVPSRRHGRSLGINLGSPESKICTWGCLYCQCGMGERRARGASDPLPAKEDVLEQLARALRERGPVDSVTFAGNSEPASHPDFLAIVQGARRIKLASRARWVLNALSNGSELDRDEAVRGLDLLDEAWIKLDCAEDDLFRRLNRPIASVGGVDAHLSRIRRLKKPRIQTLLWECPGDLRLANFTEGNRSALMAAYSEVAPVEIHLTTVQRTPAYGALTPVPAAALQGFAEELARAGFDVKAFP